MIRRRAAQERGHFDHGWLDTYHTFSFGSYYDPQQMGFRSLRVMNEDRVQPGRGFPTHGHRDMEILTYVLAGALEHRDSMGNGEVLQPGELQYMSAGTGIEHSEFNPSQTDPVHLYQIWLLPERKGLEPAYAQRPVVDERCQGRWGIVASPDGRHDSLRIRQDANLYLARLTSGESLSLALPEGRHAWLQVLRGAVDLAEQPLERGDGIAVSDEPELTIRARSDAELFWFDLA